jgi:hypothetical protein
MQQWSGSAYYLLDAEEAAQYYDVDPLGERARGVVYKRDVTGRPPQARGVHGVDPHRTQP